MKKKENFINLFTRQSEIIMLKSDNASNNKIINFTPVMEYFDSGPCWKSIKYAIFCECIDCERFLVIANKWHESHDRCFQKKCGELCESAQKILFALELFIFAIGH